MMRASSIIWCASLVPLLAFSVIKGPSIVGDIKTVSEMKEQIKSVQEELATVTSRLNKYTESTGATYFTTNESIAKVAGKLSGSVLKSISAVAENDKGEEMVCAEVRKVSDVQFFSEDTQILVFKYALEDPILFINSLKESALVVRDYTIYTQSKEAVVTVNSANYSDNVDSSVTTNKLLQHLGGLK